jgi:hypothetical protein
MRNPDSHQRLREYWDRLRGARRFPSENDLNPDDIADIWPSCFLISIDDVSRRRDYRYSYLGSDVAKACGEDADNPDVALRMLSAESIPIMSKIDEVLTTRMPVMDAAEFVNAQHQPTHYQICMFPLGYNDGEVSHILGYMGWQQPDDVGVHSAQG